MCELWALNTGDLNFCVRGAAPPSERISFPEGCVVLAMTAGLGGMAVSSKGLDTATICCFRTEASFKPLNAVIKVYLI